MAAAALDVTRKTMNENSIKLLEEFLNNNDDLEQLESIANEFNIFSSLGIINTEIRHSRFLSWLLNPKESHGLGDYYLKSFLKSVVFNSRNISNIGIEQPSIFEIDEFDLNDLEVYTEWKNIDILLKDEKNKFLCIIENKVQSTEHSNQLKRYFDIVEDEFTGYKKIFVYLTIEGDKPSLISYVPVSYNQVSRTIEKLIDNKKDKVNQEIITFIEHYNQMLKRFIMKDSELQNICRRIYRNHKKALDLIFEYKPDKQIIVKDFLVELIEMDEELLHDESSKSYIRFIPKKLDFIPKKGTGWTKTKRILLFEFKNTSKELELFLLIGPGDDEIRTKIYNLARENKKFNKVTSTLYSKWNTIYKRKIINYSKLSEIDEEEIKKVVTEKFLQIIKEDVAQITNIVLEKEDYL